VEGEPQQTKACPRSKPVKLGRDETQEVEGPGKWFLLRCDDWHPLPQVSGSTKKFPSRGRRNLKFALENRSKHETGEIIWDLQVELDLNAKKMPGILPLWSSVVTNKRKRKNPCGQKSQGREWRIV
jgi:hypothetical protein